MCSLRYHVSKSPVFALHARSKANGFTVIELMLTLGIVLILSALAAPAFNQMIANLRAKGATSDLHLSLIKARSEAIKFNREVTIQPTSGAWASGWRIVNPLNTSDSIEVHGPITNATIATSAASVIYQPTGRIKGGVAPTFGITVSGASKQSCIAIDLSGRPYVKSTSC